MALFLLVGESAINFKTLGVIKRHKLILVEMTHFAFNISDVKHFYSTFSSNGITPKHKRNTITFGA